MVLFLLMIFLKNYLKDISKIPVMTPQEEQELFIELKNSKDRVKNAAGTPNYHEVLSIEIDPDALESKEDIEMIQDSIVAALNDANKKIESESQKLLGGFGGGLGGLF